MSDSTRPFQIPAGADAHARAVWTGRLHQWHRLSAALSLVGMVLFACTGFTLNHAGQIEAHPVVVDRRAQLPPALLTSLAAHKGEQVHGGLPGPVADWARQALQAPAGGVDADWSEDEVLVSFPRPGGDAWLRIDRQSGEAEFEDTDRGWIAYLNDLHKGRHAGRAWSLFIDAFALACAVFSVTGLLILQRHAARRPSTWPLVGLGLVLPLLLAILFIH